MTATVAAAPADPRSSPSSVENIAGAAAALISDIEAEMDACHDELSAAFESMRQAPSGPAYFAALDRHAELIDLFDDLSAVHTRTINDFAHLFTSEEL